VLVGQVTGEQSGEGPQGNRLVGEYPLDIDRSLHVVVEQGVGGSRFVGGPQQRAIGRAALMAQASGQGRSVVSPRSRS